MMFRFLPKHSAIGVITNITFDPKGPVTNGSIGELLFNPYPTEIFGMPLIPT
jgi:hypothetical protein